MAEAFPLDWPAAYPRTKSRQSARFDQQTFTQARDGVFAELKRLGARRVVLSTNVRLNSDGLPDARYKAGITDPGVAVYFHWREHQKVIACDRWNRIEDNLRAIELTIAAMRGLERWGASDMLNRIFTGFTALPAPEQYWDVLKVGPQAPLEAAEQSYRELMKSAHPDRGGSEGRAAKLNWAIEQARRVWKEKRASG